MTAPELQKKLDGIAAVMKLQKEHPSIEIPNALKIIETILSEDEPVMSEEIVAGNLALPISALSALPTPTSTFVPKGSQSLLIQRSNERKELAAKMWKKGKTQAQIAKALGVTEVRVHQILQELGMREHFSEKTGSCCR